MSDVKDLFLEAEKKYGKGTLKFGDEIPKNVPILCSTGSLKLDLALGCGGIPKGRILEYFGPASGGKTSISIATISEAQKAHPNKLVAFIDLENSFDRGWATSWGVDCDKLIFSQPNTGAEAYDLMEMMIKSEKVSLIVLDSVSAMTTQAELDAEYGDAMMAQTARLMSQGLKKINAVMVSTNTDTSIIFINQIRQKIGISYGSPEVTSGGLSLGFYSSIRAEVRRGEVIGEKENPIGFITKIKLVKNKVGPPFRKIETELFIGPEKYGIDVFGEVVDLAILNSIIKKAGSWYSYGEEKLGQGRDNLINLLKNNKVMYDEIFGLVSKTVLIKDAPIEGSFQDTINNMKQESEEQKEEPKKRGRKPKEQIEEPIIKEVQVVESERANSDENIET